MPRRATRWATAVTGALLLAGCGGGAASSGGGGTDASTTVAPTSASTTNATGATTLGLGVKSGSLTFDPTTLTAKAGKVTLNLTNNGTVGHSIAVDDSTGTGVGTDGQVVPTGGTSTITIDAKPGVYKFYCTVHESQGMTGQLTVT
jgi:plastocyanin